MKPTLKNLLQAKACSFVATTIAAMAASNAAADNVRVFNKTVSGVPAANPVMISDNVFSPEFGAAFVVEGIDALENPSGVITRFGNLNTGARTEPDENTYLILDHNPGGPTAGYDYGRHFLFQGHENSGNLARGTHLVRRCFLPRKLAVTAASSRWAPILTRIREQALVCAHYMEA